ncbi:hypothetical protein DWY25_04475 [Holdemania filiformis]|uniref:Uncharacterized protein n=2 Tax=Holdemania filiformis TaxID=61171 RepID=A0A412G476_9FIRM|nr:hypothetical protein [Holdemania filiformis]RGR75496.1 hypothetical protein DWY25_04475 [Holdemania filiformis]
MEVMPVVEEKESGCFADGVLNGKPAGKIFTQKYKILVCPQCGEEVISFRKISLISRTKESDLLKRRMKIPNYCSSCGAKFAFGYALKFIAQANEEDEKNSEMMRNLKLEEYSELCDGQ